MRGANHQYEVPGFFTLLLGMLVLLGIVWLLDRRSRRDVSSSVTVAAHKTEIAATAEATQVQVTAETMDRAPLATPGTGASVAAGRSEPGPTRVALRENLPAENVGVERVGNQISEAKRATAQPVGAAETDVVKTDVVKTESAMATAVKPVAEQSLAEKVGTEKMLTEQAETEITDTGSTGTETTGTETTGAQTTDTEKARIEQSISEQAVPEGADTDKVRTGQVTTESAADDAETAVPGGTAAHPADVTNAGQEKGGNDGAAVGGVVDRGAATPQAPAGRADTHLPSNAQARGKDDLTRIKGIGMKTSRLLNENGIRTYDAVAASSPDVLAAMLREAGPMYASNNPQTWPEQATLAMRGQWEQINAGYGSNGVRLDVASEVPESSATADSEPAATPVFDRPLTTDDRSAAAAPAPLGGMVRDDLTRIAGIGPKASELLRDAGIGSFARIAQASPTQLKQVLDNGGGRFALLDPATWGQQAKLAAEGRWDDLTAMQYELAQAGSSAKNKAVDAASAGGDSDDLTRVEGIGPKIAGLLRESGISTFSALAGTPVPQLQQILSNAGTRYALADPGTWPEQAALAANERWAELQRLQDQLDGGKRV